MLNGLVRNGPSAANTARVNTSRGRDLSQLLAVFVHPAMVECVRAERESIVLTVERSPGGCAAVQRACPG
jgi:hypothetical protein